MASSGFWMGIVSLYICTLGGSVQRKQNREKTDFFIVSLVIALVSVVILAVKGKLGPSVADW